VLGALFSSPERSDDLGDVFAALVSSKTRHFVGREDALHWLDGAMQTRYSIVSGSPGIGKTSLLAKWTEDRDVVRHFFRASDVISVSPRAVLRSLLRQAERLTGVRVPLRDADGPAELLASWRQFLAATNEPILIVLDGLDEALTSNEELLSILPDPDVVAPCVSFILSGRPEVLEHHRVGPMMDRALQLTSLTLDETRVLLTTAFNTYRIVGDDGLTERVFERSQGHPLYLQLLIEDALEGRVTLSELERIPSGLPAFYRRVIERFAPPYGDTSSADLAVLLRESGIASDHIAEILTQRSRDRATLDLIALVTLLREPLVVDDLALVLKTNPDGIRRLMRRARSVLTEDSAGRVSLFHESFREFVDSESVGTPTLREAFERSAQCLQEFCTEARAIGRTYALQHWHWHLLNAAKSHRPWRHVPQQIALHELSRLARDRAWLSAQEDIGVHLPAETATAWLNAATAIGNVGGAFEAGALLVRVSRQKRSIRPSLVSATFDELQSAIQAFDPISYPALRLGWVLCQPTGHQRHRAVQTLLQESGQRSQNSPNTDPELMARRYPLPALLKLEFRILQMLAAEEEPLKALLPDLATALGGAPTLGLTALATADGVLSWMRERSSQVDELEVLAWLQAHADALSAREVEGLLLEGATRLRGQQVTQWGIEWLASHECHAEAVRVLEAQPKHTATAIALSLHAKGTLRGFASLELEHVIERGIGDLLHRDEAPNLFAQVPPGARTVVDRALREHEHRTLVSPAGRRQRSRETTVRVYLARAWLAMGDLADVERHIEEIAGPIPSQSVEVARHLIAALLPSHPHMAARLAARARGPRDHAKITSRCVGVFPHLEAKLVRGYRRIEAAVLGSASLANLDAKKVSDLLAVLEHRPDLGRAFPLEPFLQAAAGNEGQRSLVADVFMAVATADARASLMKATGSTEPVRNVERGAAQRVQVSVLSQMFIAANVRPLVRPPTVGELISRIRVVSAALQGQHEVVASELSNLAYAADDALDVLVGVLAAAGDFVTARQYAAEITDGELRDMTILYVVGRLAMMAKADDALSLCGQLTAGEAKCDGYLAVAKGLLGAGDVRRAIDTTILATQALLEAPHTESLRMLRRESLLALARLGHLVPVRDLVALKIANDAPNRVDLALECYRSGHVATAIAELDDLARRWTGDGQRDPGSGVELVRALVEVGMGETALEVAASVERASASNNVWFYLAVEAGSRSFKRLALEALSRGCSREGAQDESESNIRGISDAVAAIGELLAKLGHCREAMELLKNAVDAFGMSTVHHHDAFALRRVLDAMDAEVWPASANEPTTEVATSTAEPPCQEDACGEVTPNTLPPDLADLMDPEFAAHLSDLNTKTGLLPAPSWTVE
jgi:hypothetical protein